MEVVSRVEALRPDLGPAFVVVGVFDGIHLGHLYLLRHLVGEAAARRARPTVITFDHHPDEVLTGHAPPLLLDPAERLERLAEAGVDVTVVQPFDAALRETPYDAFIERIRGRVELRGLLMTPDAAIGYQRQGTPEILAALGRRDGFDVVVIQPFTLDGRPVRSSEIRSAIAAGDLTEASALLGRPLTLTGAIKRDGPLGRRIDFDLPIALPPDGEYPGHVDGEPVVLRVDAGVAYLLGRGPGARRVTVELSARAATTARPPRARGSRSEP
jgi:riboflavin kinase/FMN adenylyltransferase